MRILFYVLLNITPENWLWKSEATGIATVQQNDPVLRRSLAGIKTTFDAVADPQTHDVNVVIRLAKP